MKTIAQYLQRVREKDNKKYDRRIEAEFKVEERGGFLWLTHDGRAFAQLNEALTVDYIAGYLADARKAAVTFNSL